MHNMKKKLLLYKTLLFLSAGVTTFAASYGSKVKEKEETIEKVSSNVRSELYAKDILDSFEYFKEYSKEEKTEYGIARIATETSDDKFITAETLEKVTKLRLDMSQNEDLAILKKCPNLSELTISYAELLVDADIESINNSSVNKVILEFNQNNVNQIRESKFDVSRIKNKELEINLDLFDSELNKLVLINYLENYSDEVFKESDAFDNLNKIDQKLNDILASLNLTKEVNDEGKILLIANYICYKLQYDEEISVYLGLKDLRQLNYRTKINSEEKISYYNINELSSVLMEDDDVEAICINYASLFDILCYKAGIKSRLVLGSNREDGHAWNIVYLNDGEKYVDLTWVDNSIYQNFLINYSRNGTEYYPKEAYYDLLVDYMFEVIGDKHGSFNTLNDISTLDASLKKNEINYYNEDIEGSKVLNEDIDITRPVFTSLTSGVLAISFYEMIRQKKNQDKKKIK